MTWTPERTQQLRDMWMDGKSAGQIAEILGDTTRNAVIGKVNREGLHRDEEKVRRTRLYLGAKAILPRKPRAVKPAKPRRFKSPNNFAAVNAAARQRRERGRTEPLHLRPTIVDATMAKPWTERAFGECAYPISGEGADTFSCCCPTERTYCEAHEAVMYVEPQTTPKQLIKLARRYAA